MMSFSRRSLTLYVLPVEILLSVMYDWIVVDDLRNLDSATCNKCLRKHLFSSDGDKSLKSLQLNTKHRFLSYYEVTGSLRWLGIRKIKVKELFFGDKFKKHSVLLYYIWDLNVEHIETLCFLQGSMIFISSLLTDFINSCSRVRHLSFHLMTTISVSSFKLINQCVWFSLQSLTVNWCKKFCGHCVLHLVNSCRSLEKLTLEVDHSALKSTRNLCALISNNKHSLKALHFRGVDFHNIPRSSVELGDRDVGLACTDVVFTHALNVCQNLVEIKISNHGLTNTREVLRAVMKTMSVKSFSVQTSIKSPGHLLEIHYNTANNNLYGGGNIVPIIMNISDIVEDEDMSETFAALSDTITDRNDLACLSIVAHRETIVPANALRMLLAQCEKIERFICTVQNVKPIDIEHIVGGVNNLLWICTPGVHELTTGNVTKILSSNLKINAYPIVDMPHTDIEEVKLYLSHHFPGRVVSLQDEVAAENWG